MHWCVSDWCGLRQKFWTWILLSKENQQNPKFSHWKQLGWIKILKFSVLFHVIGCNWINLVTVWLLNSSLSSVCSVLGSGCMRGGCAVIQRGWRLTQDLRTQHQALNKDLTLQPKSNRVCPAACHGMDLLCCWHQLLVFPDQMWPGWRLVLLRQHRLASGR